MTRQQIMQQRIDTGNAEYHWDRVLEYRHITDYECMYKSEARTICRRDISIYDILFWPSNFFEVMFPQKISIFSEDEEKELMGEGWIDGNWTLYIDRKDYYKMLCAIAKDKLQYISEVLNKE